MRPLASTVLWLGLAVVALFGAVQVRDAVVARRVRSRVSAAGAAGPRAAGRSASRPASRRTTPGALMLVAGTGGLAAAAVAGGVTVAAVLVLAGVAVPAAGHLRQRSARRSARSRQLPEALDRLATSLRSGSSLPVALDEAGRAQDAPIGPELAGVAAAARRGTPVRRALDDWSTAHGDPGTHLAATALVLAEVVGSTPARAVDGVAATLRERLDLAAERQALAVQARTSSLVLSVAPVGFAAVLVMADTAAAAFLLGTPAGLACLAAGICLDALGAWWMARLCRSDER